MFERSFVQSTSLLRGRRLWTLVVSVAIEVVIVAALVYFPLMHPEIVHLSTPPMMVFAPPPVRQLPPPPTRIVRAETASSAPAPQVATMQTPRIARSGFSTDAPTVDQPELALGIDLGAGGQSPLAAIGSVGPRSAVVGVAAAGPSPGPMKISTGVMAGRLLEPIEPQYPAIAKITRSEGTVVVTAIISKTGTIESARVASGPAVLQGAALDAVKRARYRPYLLNGQPTEVETTISITFRLGS